MGRKGMCGGGSGVTRNTGGRKRKISERETKKDGRRQATVVER